MPTNAKRRFCYKILYPSNKARDLASIDRRIAHCAGRIATREKKLPATLKIPTKCASRLAGGSTSLAFEKFLLSKSYDIQDRYREFSSVAQIWQEASQLLAQKREVQAQVKANQPSVFALPNAVRSIGQIEEAYGPLRIADDIPVAMKNFQIHRLMRWIPTPFWFHQTYLMPARPPIRPIAIQYERTFGPLYIQLFPTFRMMWRTKDCIMRSVIDGRTFMHPHVNTGGVPCLGEAAMGLQSLWKGGEWFAYLESFLGLMNQYNPGSPHAHIETFFERRYTAKQCPRCKSTCQAVHCACCGQRSCGRHSSPIIQTGAFICHPCCRESRDPQGFTKEEQATLDQQKKDREKAKTKRLIAGEARQQAFAASLHPSYWSTS